MEINVGVIGAGTHGARYVRHLAQGDAPGLRPVLLCRRDEAAGRALQERFGVPWVGDAEALIDDAAVGAVVIATPPSSHFALARRALAAGKPVLLEKPMTGTLAEARELAALAGAPGAATLMVAQTLRWNPVLMRARARWPELGPVHLVRLSQRLAPTTLAWQREAAMTVGGSVLLTGVHLFDLVRWLTGREVVRVDSRQRQVLNPVVEDLFLARAELDDGCWATFEVSKYTQSRACWLEAIGEHGQLTADYQEGSLLWRRGAEEVLEQHDAAAPTLPAALAAWRDAIAAGASPPVTVRDGLATLAVVDACYRSARAGAEVVVEPA